MRPIFPKIKESLNPELPADTSMRKLPGEWSPEDQWSLADHMNHAGKLFKNWSDSVKKTVKQ